MSTHWEDHAVCHGTMLELWFGPEEYEEPPDQTRWRQRRAAEFCENCPVRTECLIVELARPLSEQHGIRGGLTASGRERLLSRWRTDGLVPAYRPPTVEVVRELLEESGESDLPPARRHSAK